MSFSSGPWRYQLVDRIHKISSKDGNVCIIAHEDSPNIDKASNARLLACAPELLDVIEALFYGHRIGMTQEMNDRVVNLIKKARGD